MKSAHESLRVSSFETLPQSVYLLCSPSRASRSLGRVSSGVWGHCLIACDMLTRLLWLSWFLKHSASSSRFTLWVCSQHPSTASFKDWLQMFPCRLILWSLPHRGGLQNAGTPAVKWKFDSTGGSVMLHYGSWYVASAQTRNKSLVHSESDAFQ